MLRGLTDREIDIQSLLEFCAGLQVEINLIPYNTSSDADPTSSTMLDSNRILERSDRTWEIAQRLRSEGYFTTIRYSGGQSIAAACGQLAVKSDGEFTKVLD